MTMNAKTLCARLALAMLILVSLSAHADELVARADRTSIGVNDTFTFTLRKSGRSQSGTPDFDILRQHFEILGNQRSQQTRIVNGQMQAWTEWRLTLAPRREGELVIPAFEFQGARSEPITISVQERQREPGSSDEPIFIETELNKDTARVQEQVLFTVRLYSQVNLDGAEIQPLELGDAIIKAVDENNYITQINDRQHLVLESTFAIFPQRSGTLEIPALDYEVAVSRGQRSPWGTRGSRQRISGEAQTLEVTSRPQEFQGDTWLPARDLRLTQHWSSDPGNLRQGEPVTRRITLEADGLTSAQLPEITLPATDSVSFYPDRPQTDEQINASGVRSSSTFTVAMVPNRSGRHTLPAVQIQWWDTEAQELRTAELPETEIRVSAVPGAAPASEPEPRSREPEERNGETAPTPEAPQVWGLWQWLLLGALAILLAISLWLAVTSLRLKRELDAIHTLHREDQRQERIALGRAWHAVKLAAKGDDLNQLRRALLDWARVYWTEQPPKGLTELAGRIGGERLHAQLAQLDAILYRGDPADGFDARALIQELNRWRASHRSESRPEAGLKPLYRNRG